MRIFVAGATGVIGARLVPALTRRGHEVVVQEQPTITVSRDNLPYNQVIVLPGS